MNPAQQPHARAIAPNQYINHAPPPAPFKLPTAAALKVEMALSGSLATSTAKKYRYSVAAFERFCDAIHIPPLQRFPANEDLLCAFAANGVREKAESTIRNALSAVKAAHIRRGLRWHGGPRLALVVKGVANLAPPSSKAAQRPPVTADMIATLATTANLTAPLDAAILATAAVALWGQARLGELLPESKATPLIHLPCLANLKPLSATRLSRTLHLPYTKVKRNQGEDIVITNQSGLANPLPIIENHLRVNNPSASDPLFSYATSNGPRRILTKAAFLRRCNEIWAAQGLAIAKGHSFRIGGTTELLKAGVPPDVVKKMGRWNSDHCLTYWRELQTVGERHAANASSRG